MLLHAQTQLEINLLHHLDWMEDSFVRELYGARIPPRAWTLAATM